MHDPFDVGLIDVNFFHLMYCILGVWPIQCIAWLMCGDVLDLVPVELDLDFSRIKSGIPVELVLITFVKNLNSCPKSIFEFLLNLEC